ncbi:hypothetical protein C3B44_05915 [Corynebacterium yudongzhengii]|uniref:Uncharacterized protein n=1 Tax=Corynebacterium yudongzhengii TaxID=2080740 RepID=A0A2U1T8X6_9CORY|nr:hypothetical protein [Corynebacterium yudongzhengii]AWB81946.1 hypothetical protein C3B44_05915 [Corynebacterium yudongzhengii]PWC02338.1 hypothetical protein DF222_03135 [Corynebacterium yudongzhengii]
MTYSVNEAVEQTLLWVTHGEPSADDLLDVATSGFAVIGKYGGFQANDHEIKALADFHTEDGTSACTIEVYSPTERVVLTIDGEEHTYDSHEEGVRAFYEWAAAAEVTS